VTDGIMSINRKLLIVLLIAFWIVLLNIPFNASSYYSGNTTKEYIVHDPRVLVAIEFANEPVMIRIADAESDFNPLAKNPHSSAKGIFQIIDGTWKHYKCEGDVLNAVDNIQCARKIYDKENTHPWKASEHVWNHY